MAAETFELVRDGKPASVIVVGQGPGDEHAARLLARTIAEITGVDLPMVDAGDSPEGRDLVHVGTLSREGEAMDVLREKRSLVSWADREQDLYKRMNIPADLGDEGFIFDAARQGSQGHLVLGGATRQGTLYAAVTASQRLCLEGDSLSIRHIDTILQPRINTPLFRNRSVATVLGGPDFIAARRWEKDWGRPDGTYDWRGFVDFLVGHKINNLSCWTFNLAWGIVYDSARFPEMVNRRHPNAKKEFMRDLIDYAAEQGIDTWLMLDFPENWTGVIKARPHLAGKNIDVARLPDGEAWESYMTGDSNLDVGRDLTTETVRASNAEAVRRTVGWVCGAEPEVKEIWREYIQELLERYPNVRGIGGQFGEHPGQRCDCSTCSERYFDIQREFFDELVKTAHDHDREIVPWVYDSLGTREITKAAEGYPGFVNLDWGRHELAYKFHTGRQVPRSNWYFQNGLGGRWQESLVRFGTRTLASLGHVGYQVRGVLYRDHDEAYHALQEFTWNRALDEEGFALLHVLRRYHREDKALAALYASWIRVNGLRAQLRSYPDWEGWVDRAELTGALGLELSRFQNAMSDADDGDEFAADIGSGFEKLRDELNALAKGE